jgi:hypothetical protein
VTWYTPLGVVSKILRRYALLLMALVCFLPTGVYGSIIADADLTIPTWTPGTSIPGMSLFSTSSQSFMVMITAPPDMPAYPAYLAFSASLSAQPFWGSPASEYMSSHAGITFSVPGGGGASLTTPAASP